jgi:ABC-type phosphate transport system substrate-binding protein
VDRKIIRATRQDNSGTTYAFKDFLDFAAQIDDGSDTDPRTGDGSDTDWRPGLTSTPLLNRSWPNTTPDNGADVEEDNPPQDPTLGETAGSDADSLTTCFGPSNPIYSDAPVCHNRATGNGGTVAVTRSNVGSIGYADLATVRSSTASSSFQKENAGDSLYTMPIAVRDSVTAFVDPAKDPNGFKQFKSGSADQQPSGGAACDDVTIRDLPSGSDPTTGTGWDVTSMVYPAAGYGICTLTYVLAWDDNAPVYVSGLGGNYALEERRARAVKDYLDFVVSDTGQSLLTTADYSVLPEAVQTLADTAVDRIDWDKANTGNTGGGDTGTNSGNDGGAGGGTTVVANPAPSGTAPVGGPLAAPINAFTIPSTRTRGSDVFATFRLPGAGQLVVAATGRYTEKVKRRIRRGGRTRTRTRNVRRTVQVARATVTVSRAGDLSVRLPVSSAARRALRKTSRMVVTVTAVFTPVGGQANTVTRTLTLRGTRRR